MSTSSSSFPPLNPLVSLMKDDNGERGNGNDDGLLMDPWIGMREK